MTTEGRVQLTREFLAHVEALLEALGRDGVSNLSWTAQDEFRAVKREIEWYYERRTKRQAFTRYKTAEPNTPEREVARQEYLDAAGIMSDWQSSREIPEGEGF